MVPIRWVAPCLLALAGMMAGCAHPISGSFRDQVDEDLAFGRVLQTPERFEGEKVVLGGIIVKTRNFEGWTEIEAVQVPLDCWGYPYSRDDSEGRVIFRYEGYLEPEIYAKNREVTVGGTVAGSKSGKIDEKDYQYPVVKVEEIRLWEDYGYPYYGYPYYGYPYGYGYPGPFYGRGFYGRGFYGGPLYW